MLIICFVLTLRSFNSSLRFDIYATLLLSLTISFFIFKNLYKIMQTVNFFSSAINKSLLSTVSKDINKFVFIDIFSDI